MKEVRLGIVGVGGMGGSHANNVLAGTVNRLRLAAVCDINPAQMTRFDPAVKRFERSEELIRSGEVDAILVATPHYFHTTIGMDALANGLHLLVEKPISVHKADCERLIQAAQKAKKQVFGAMFNQRTDPHYRKVRDLIQSGELGQLTRVNWIITNWFRTQHYYDSGGWRATWKGEGGGVLLNQCPHNLDLLQWLCGMPVRMRAFCQFGKWHEIEVEDQVTAYFEYANGATGVFITTTGEAPGTNRLEICGDRGKVVIENGEVSFTRNTVPMHAFCRTAKSGFATPETWNIKIPVNNGGGQHNEILQNFTDAILDGTPLLAPAVEGINSVELANAMLQSSFTGKTVELPLDGAVYEKMLKKLIRDSRFEKKAGPKGAAGDLSSSFNTGGK
jgi:predicted dehydrogenase